MDPFAVLDLRKGMDTVAADRVKGCYTQQHSTHVYACTHTQLHSDMCVKSKFGCNDLLMPCIAHHSRHLCFVSLMGMYQCYFGHA